VVRACIHRPSLESSGVVGHAGDGDRLLFSQSSGVIGYAGDGDRLLFSDGDRLSFSESSGVRAGVGADFCFRSQGGFR
jgi:hypothetical protein